MIPVKVDLQIQTNASDGEFGIERILDFIFKENVTLFAITDHDTTGAWYQEDRLRTSVELYNERFRANKPVVMRYEDTPGMFAVGNVRVIQGEEITCHYRDKETHLLAYFLDQSHMDAESNLYKHNRRMWNAHRGWAKALCKELSDSGYPVSYEEVLEKAVSSYGLKPYILPRFLQARHGEKIASELNMQGTPDIKEINKWLNKKYQISIERYYQGPDESNVAPFPDIKDTIDMVLDVGGVPVLSHPGRYEHITEPEPVIKELLDLSNGLIGFEVYNSRQTEAKTKLWEAAVNAAGALKTGGSDFHGHAHRKEERVGVNMDQRDIDVLFARHQEILNRK